MFPWEDLPLWLAQSYRDESFNYLILINVRNHDVLGTAWYIK